MAEHNDKKSSRGKSETQGRRKSPRRTDGYSPRRGRDEKKNGAPSRSGQPSSGGRPDSRPDRKAAGRSAGPDRTRKAAPLGKRDDTDEAPRPAGPKRGRGVAPLPLQVPQGALFAALPEAVREVLDGYGGVLKRVFKLKPKHQRELPYAVRDLSRLLTRDREDLKGDYLRTPPAVAAYCHYFLPWNLYRLTLLFSRLPLVGPAAASSGHASGTDGEASGSTGNAADSAASESSTGLSGESTAASEEAAANATGNASGKASAKISAEVPGDESADVSDNDSGEAGEGKRFTVIDVGSGPLTVAQALWAALPQWRGAEIDLTCVDQARRSMTAGLDLFRALDTESRWRVRLVQDTVVRGLGKVRGQADLITAANVLNELNWDREDDLGTQVDRIVRRLSGKVAPGGMLLLVEPGTRLGGRLMAAARLSALENGLLPVSPCPHFGPCPLAAERAPGWCHFRASASGAPAWLADLTRTARLVKDEVSVSFLLLQKPADEAQVAEIEAARAEKRARVVSDVFPVDGRPARYGCSPDGLLLLTHGPERHPALNPGGLVAYELPGEPERDKRSGALKARVLL